MTDLFTLKALAKQAKLRDRKIYFKQKINKLLKKINKLLKKLKNLIK